MIQAFGTKLVKTRKTSQALTGNHTLQLKRKVSVRVARVAARTSPTLLLNNLKTHSLNTSTIPPVTFNLQYLVTLTKALHSSSRKSLTVNPLKDRPLPFPTLVTKPTVKSTRLQKLFSIPHSQTFTSPHQPYASSPKTPDLTTP